MFFRLHQLLSVAFVVCTVQHILIVKAYSYLTPLYIAAGLFFIMSFLQVLPFVYYNLRSRKNGAPSLESSVRHNLLHAKISVPRPLKIDAGQYIKIWVPSVSLFTSYSVLVTSWSSHPQTDFEILAVPSRDITAKLFQKANTSLRTLHYTAFISGPYGNSIPLWQFSEVVLFATSRSILSTLPYLRKLIHGTLSGLCNPTRISLVWQTTVEDIGRFSYIFLPP